MYYSIKSSKGLSKEINTYLTLEYWKENEASFTLELDLPGFSNNEITVTSKASLISITASPKQTNKRAPFSAEYKLPSSAITSESTAVLENGVLTVTVPKKEQEKVNVIPVK